MQILRILIMLPFCLQAVSLLDDRDQIKPEVQRFLDHCNVPRYETLDQLNHYLQEHWLQLNKERWQFEPRMQNLDEALWGLLQDIGCIDAIQSEQETYDYALVLGATGPSMQQRVDFLCQEYERGVRFGQVVLLSGQRDLDPNIERFPDTCTSETDLLVHLYTSSALCNRVPFHVVDSQKILIEENRYRRPNTAKTVADWLATQPIPGSCIVISNQPFVGYQEAVVRSFLPQEFTVEAVGPAAKIPENFPESRRIAVLLDNFAKWFYAEHQHKRAQ